jgi:hypothetical protein
VTNGCDIARGFQLKHDNYGCRKSFSHGRYSGWPGKPVVDVGIFKILDGKLVRTPRLMQEEVPASIRISGNVMF